MSDFNTDNLLNIIKEYINENIEIQLVTNKDIISKEKCINTMKTLNPYNDKIFEDKIYGIYEDASGLLIFDLVSNSRSELYDFTSNFIGLKFEINDWFRSSDFYIDRLYIDQIPLEHQKEDNKYYLSISIYYKYDYSIEKYVNDKLKGSF